jgi:hypothetical protein
MSEQQRLTLGLAGVIADLRDKLAREDAAKAARDPHAGLRRAMSGMLRCACCGQPYPRGQWRCCAAPNGMKWENWRALWCDDCPNPNLEEEVPSGKSRCPRHCGCERTVAGNLPIPRTKRITKADVDALRAELLAASPAAKGQSNLPVTPADVAEAEHDPEFLKSEWPE